MPIGRLTLVIVVHALLAAGPIVPGTAAQQVVRSEQSSEPLGRRVASAMQQATLDGGSAMVGYGIVVRAPANQIWGMYSLKESSRPTLFELIHSRSIGNDRPATGNRRSESDDERIVDRSVAVLIRLDSAGRVSDVHLYTLDSIADFDVETIRWLGDASREESFDLLKEYLGEHYDVEVRRGAVYALSRHALPDLAHSILLSLIHDRNEPPELRKAAVHGLGMLHTEEARRALLDLIYDETS